MDTTPPNITEQTSTSEDTITASSAPSAASTTDTDPPTLTPLSNVAVLFCRDLRLHDNPTLTRAAQHAVTLTPIYCVTPLANLQNESLVHEKRFLLDALHDLRMSLMSKGSNLVIRVGQPEQILPEICETYNITTVFTAERESNEAADGSPCRKLAKMLHKKNTILTEIPGNTLYEERDLPLKIHEIDSSTALLESEVSQTRRRHPLPVPALPPYLNSITPGIIPTLPELGYSGPPSIGHSFLDLVDMPGGETEALTRLSSLIQESGMLPIELEPWLEIGCISSKKIFFEYRKTVSLEIAVNSCNYYFLVMRDYYTFFGPKYFRLYGESRERKRKRGKESAMNRGGPYRAFERS